MIVTTPDMPWIAFAVLGAVALAAALPSAGAAIRWGLAGWPTALAASVLTPVAAVIAIMTIVAGSAGQIGLQAFQGDLRLLILSSLAGACVGFATGLGLRRLRVGG